MDISQNELDLLLDQEGDLQITESGDVILTDSIRQAIIIRLKWFLGEWKYNKIFGLPYYEKVLIKNPQPELLKQIFSNQILSVKAVIAVNNIKIELDRKKRTFLLKFEAVTTRGRIKEEVEIGYELA